MVFKVKVMELNAVSAADKKYVGLNAVESGEKVPVPVVFHTCPAATVTVPVSFTLVALEHMV